MEIIIPAHFAGPIPHAHDGFDEAIYALSGQLQVTGDDQPRQAAAGSMFAAPRRHRHGFSNPYDSDALVLGVWAPAEPAIAFMRDIGAALIPGTPPDPLLQDTDILQLSDPGLDGIEDPHEELNVDWPWAPTGPRHGSRSSRIWNPGTSAGPFADKHPRAVLIPRNVLGTEQIDFMPGRMVVVRNAIAPSA
jgi:hypothetical protein